MPPPRRLFALLVGGVCAVLVGGLLARLDALPIHWDESAYAYWALSGTKGPLGSYWMLYPFTGGAHLAALAFWTRLFGPSLLSVRVFEFAIAAAGLALLALFARDCFDVPPVLAWLLLVSFLPVFALCVASVHAEHGFLILAAGLALYSLARYERGGGRRDLFAAAAAVGFGVYVKLIFPWFAGGLAVGSLAFKRALRRPTLRDGLIAAALVLAGALPVLWFDLAGRRALPSLIAAAWPSRLPAVLADQFSQLVGILIRFDFYTWLLRSPAPSWAWATAPLWLAALAGSFGGLGRGLVDARRAADLRLLYFVGGCGFLGACFVPPGHVWQVHLLFCVPFLFLATVAFWLQVRLPAAARWLAVAFLMTPSWLGLRRLALRFDPDGRAIADSGLVRLADDLLTHGDWRPCVPQELWETNEVLLTDGRVVPQDCSDLSQAAAVALLSHPAQVYLVRSRDDGRPVRLEDLPAALRLEARRQGKRIAPWRRYRFVDMESKTVSAELFAIR